MKNKLLLATAVNLCLSSSFAIAGEGATNGGDICENKLSSIVLDIKGWIQNNGGKQLSYTNGLTSEEYKAQMLEVIESNPIIKCQTEELLFGSAEKTCLNTTNNGNAEIVCNLDRIESSNIEEKYRIIHHEIAGLAGIEVNETESSDYFYSNQITANLEEQLVKKLAIKKSADFGIEMANIPAGTFLMSYSTDFYNSPGEKEHNVTLTKDFEIMKDEVTQAQWFAVMGKNPAVHKLEKYCPETYEIRESKEFGFDELCPTHPIENVNKKQIKEFIKKLNEMTGEKYRLPTEAEWEYAARGGRKTEYFYGNRVDFLNKFVVSKFNAENQTHPVGSKRDFANTPNAFGLYDVSGNVMEIVEDNYSWLPEEDQVDPFFSEEKGDVLGRGGSYQSNEFGVRSAHRTFWYRERRFNDTGFRLAK